MNLDWFGNYLCDISKNLIFKFRLSVHQLKTQINYFSSFSCRFLNPNIFFSNLNYICSNLLDIRNLQKQVKKLFSYQKLFWPFIVWINFSRDLKNFRHFSQSQEQFFLTVGQNNFGNKIPMYLSFQSKKAEHEESAASISGFIHCQYTCNSKPYRI